MVLHINTYLQPSTVCTNPYKYDLSVSDALFLHGLNVAWINCTVLSIFALWLGYLSLKKIVAYSFTKGVKEIQQKR